MPSNGNVRCAETIRPPGADGDPAVAAYRDRILRRGQGAEAILAAAAEAPGSALVLACAASHHLLTDTRAGIGEATRLIERAERLAAGWHERGFVSALAAVARGEVERAEAAFLALAGGAPEDLLAGYLGHLFFLDHGRLDAMLAQARLLAAAGPDDPFALGMLGFALHETGAVEAAWEAVLAAEAADGSVPWVHHAAAHVFLTCGEHEAGGRWLAERAPHWRRCGSSMLSHNWWHAQLLLLEAGDTDGPLALYDRLLAPEALRAVSSYVNAAQLLARIELAGGAVGDRWQPLAHEAAGRLDEHVLPFIDLHLALALARAGDEAALAALLRSAWQHAGATSGRLRQVWERAGLPLLDAVAAYGRGDLARAAEGFARGLPHLASLGGSGQQRALFQALARRAITI